jgi:hypothetical protein
MTWILYIGGFDIDTKAFPVHAQIAKAGSNISSF